MNTLITTRAPRRRSVPARRGLLAADRLFDDLWSGFGVMPNATSAFTPRIDVRETDDEYVVTAELPGLEEKDVELTFDDNVLTLKGEKRTDHSDESAGYKHVESVAGHFERTFAFPVEVEADKVTATAKNGILTVTLPKPADAKKEPRTIPVTTA